LDAARIIAVLVVCTVSVAFLTLRFIGKLRQAREALAQSQERLNLTLHASGIGVWNWDIATDNCTGDDNCCILFGLPLGQFPKAVAGFAALLHPDDRERIQLAIAAAIDNAAGYNTEYRVVWPDGSSRSLISRAKVYYGDGGRAAQFTGVCWDVTERQQAEENLRRANEKLTQSLRELERLREQAATLRKMTDLLQGCSSSGEAYEIVAQFCAHLFPTYSGALYIFSASRNLVKGVAAWNDPAVSDAAFDPDECWALRRGQPHITDAGPFATPCRHLKGIPGGHACFPLMAQGTGLGVLYLQGRQQEEFLTLEDRQLAITVAENAAISLSNLYLQEALRIQSIRDPVTGLFNRRYLEESGERELYRMARGKHPAGFAMMDLDHFKTFNDTFGHEGGDALLRGFGQFLREHLRKEDIACRYGGEEFCVLFCESSLDDTVRRAEQLRLEVQQLTVQHAGQSLGAITISIGVACYPTNGTILTDLIAAADAALYQAKKDGRNRVAAAP
jgi:diguanylate cyclase (GGDEF)-like protein